MLTEIGIAAHGLVYEKDSEKEIYSSNFPGSSLKVVLCNLFIGLGKAIEEELYECLLFVVGAV